MNVAAFQALPYLFVGDFFLQHFIVLVCKNTFHISEEGFLCILAEMGFCSQQLFCLFIEQVGACSVPCYQALGRLEFGDGASVGDSVELFVVVDADLLWVLNVVEFVLVYILQLRKNQTRLFVK